MKVNPLLRGLPPCGARIAMMSSAHLARIDAKARFKRYSFRREINTPGWSHWGRSLMPIAFRIGRSKELSTACRRAINHYGCPF